MPQEGPVGALRLRREEVAEHIPQAGQVLALDLLIEGLTFRRLGDRHKHGRAPHYAVDAGFDEDCSNKACGSIFPVPVFGSAAT
jgi:hypothetical protein